MTDNREYKKTIEKLKRYFDIQYNALEEFNKGLALALDEGERIGFAKGLDQGKGETCTPGTCNEVILAVERERIKRGEGK